MKISELNDKQLCNLIDNRWNSSSSVWSIVSKTYDQNLRYYKNDPEWVGQLPKKQPRVRANRIFVNTEAVINALIANLPKPVILTSRDTPQAKELATLQEKYFARKYADRNVKEVLRKGLRNLYLSRLIVLKPFWDAKINDFNVRAIDPKKVRLSKDATKEDDSEFAIEEVDDSLLSIVRRFPKKKDEILKKAGIADETALLINNPQATYKECWIRDYTIFKYEDIILGKTRNPYWDWDGLLVTEEEEQQIGQAETTESRRNVLAQIKMSQSERVNQKVKQAQGNVQPGEMPVEETADEAQSFQAYYFNHFDRPRKPYIIATAFNNENTPVGQTDLITQAIPLYDDAAEMKRNITRNARFVNGIWKIDSSVMEKADAQRLDTETGGVIWGKGVAGGAVRETGQPLPAFVFQNYQDNLSEIDNIMAASSAFKGEREGQETKGGRLALIEQSFLRLNELVQVVDYVNYELFNWFYQLAKVRYTEHHYAKTLGKDTAVEILTLIQDDFEDGTEVRVISGKTLPEDRQFRFEQAQADVQKGILSPVDYFEAAGYENPAEKARNKVKYDINPPHAVGISPEEMQQIAPPQAPQDVPSTSIKYDELPIDGKIQLAEKAGIILSPSVLIAEKQQEMQQQDKEMQMKQTAKPEKKAT